MMFYPMARAKCARSLPYSKKWSKMKFLTIVSSMGSCAHIWRARHRIENHESNILCIYIMFISSKLAEIDRFEKGR